MRIVFSRDRAAQLDLLLRSLQKFVPAEKTYVLWHGTTKDFVAGYDRLGLGAQTLPITFDYNLRWILTHDDDEYVTFFCDDDVVFGDLYCEPAQVLEEHDDTLTFSWRLSGQPEQTGLPFVLSRWNWTFLPRTDHGYPGSIDGHTFRVADVLEMLGDYKVPNPTMLETRLAARCEDFVERRPLMASPVEQVLVGVPVNRVSEPSGCRFGELFPQPTEELNRRFLDGQRIALEQLDFSQVTSCHHELQFVWEPR